jgi:hypothetical protein
MQRRKKIDRQYMYIAHGGQLQKGLFAGKLERTTRAVAHHKPAAERLDRGVNKKNNKEIHLFILNKKIVR